MVNWGESIRNWAAQERANPTSKRFPTDPFYSIIRDKEKHIQTLARMYVREDQLPESNNVSMVPPSPESIKPCSCTSWDRPTSHNDHESFLTRSDDQPTKRIKLELEEQNNSFETPVNTDPRVELDSLFVQFKKICHFDQDDSDLSKSNPRLSHKGGTARIEEQKIAEKKFLVSNFYAKILNQGLQDGLSISKINTIALLTDKSDESIAMLHDEFAKICEAVESNSKYNGTGPNLFGTGVARFLTCSKGCTCILQTSNNETSTCSACKSPYNPNSQAALISLRELYREKFKNKKVAEMEWFNVNRYIENLRAQKTEETPEHLQRMMENGFFDLDNSRKKKKIIDIPFVILMDANSLLPTTDLEYYAAGGFNLAENSLQMKSKENVHPLYIYPKVHLHTPSNNSKPNIENKDGNSGNDEEKLDVTACGVFQPLVDEFISLS